MFFLKKIRVLFVLCLLGVSFCATAVEIDLLSSVVVDKKNYQLGDIAILSSANGREGALNRIEIGLSPRPGSKHYINRDQIKAKLYRLRPDIVKSVKWSGAELVKITSFGKLLEGDDIISVADRALTQWSVQNKFVDYEFSLLKKPDDIMLPKGGKIKITASVGDSIKRALARMPVWVDIKVDGQQYHSYQMWYRFRATRPVYVASHYVPAKTFLNNEMFTQKVVEVTSLAGKPSDNLDHIISKRLSAALTPGDILMSKNLEVMPLVSKGDTVEVGVKLGGVDITTKAIALKDGHLKEKISVLNPTTNDSYYVTVIDQNKVRVR